MQHTIFAVSTPPGRGGIGIIRISGERALPALHTVFFSKQTLRPRTMAHGEVRLNGHVVDDALAVYFAQPHSYTGEPMCELHCHGNPVLLEAVMAKLGELEGCRVAMPGEFTRRAYENQKMDLLAAEAVMGTISASSERALAAMQRHLRGEAGEKVKDLCTRLRLAVAGLCAAVDFAEDDWEEDAIATAQEELRALKGEVELMCRRSKTGQMLTQGIRCALIGKPNVGKSSILNAIAGFPRAIVDEEAGTTRDVIEHAVDYQGTVIRWFDTAGRRTTAQRTEKIGLTLGEKAAQAADVLVWVVDASNELTADDLEAAQLCRVSGVQQIIAFNKTDLSLRITPEELLQHLPGATLVEICAKESKIQPLLNAVLQAAGIAENEELMFPAMRHRECLERAQEALCRAVRSMQEGFPSDIVSLDAEEALRALCELSGEDARESVIDTIFSTFCVGK